MTRDDFLAKVQEILRGHRDNDNEEEDCFLTIASLWEIYLNESCIFQDSVVLNRSDVSMLMCLLKIARFAHGHTRLDDCIDIAGYAACAATSLPEGQHGSHR